MSAKLTDAEVDALVESEGLDYAIMYYTDGKNFENPKLRKLWRAAGEKLRAIETILEATR